MKKLIASISAVTMVLSLAGCSGGESLPQSDNTVSTTAVVVSTTTAVTTSTEGETVSSSTIPATKTEMGADEADIEYVVPEEDEFEYSYDATLEGVKITHYYGNDEDIRIPAELNGYPVKEIAIDINYFIKHVEIPDSVTTISDRAFVDCYTLESIIIPDSVIVIGEYAFLKCSHLTSITIPNGVTSIESGTFSDCNGLTSITIPDSVTVIGDYAFAGCENLANVTIPYGVTYIGLLAFNNCSNLESLNVPDSVEEIGMGAFYSNEGLTITYKGIEYTYENDPNHWWS